MLPLLILGIQQVFSRENLSDELPKLDFENLFRKGQLGQPEFHPLSVVHADKNWILITFKKKKKIFENSFLKNDILEFRSKALIVNKIRCFVKIFARNLESSQFEITKDASFQISNSDRVKVNIFNSGWNPIVLAAICIEMDANFLKPVFFLNFILWNKPKFWASFEKSPQFFKYSLFSKIIYQNWTKEPINRNF